MSINFTTTDRYNETECYMCRSAKIMVEDGPYEVDYQVIITMTDPSGTIPKITEVHIEQIPDLDDYAFGPGLSEDEEDRRQRKRDMVYDVAQQLLNAHYMGDTK